MASCSRCSGSHILVTTTSTGQTKQALVLRAENTKTNRERVVPVSARLATVLTMRRHAPDGVAYGPDGVRLRECR